MTVSAVETLQRHYPDGVFAKNCPSRTVLEHVTSKWGGLVLVILAEGRPVRWSELRRRAEGISEKMLAQTLRILVADGLVIRDARPVVPPYVEYSLTSRGQEFAALYLPMMAWIAENAADILGERTP